MAGSPKSTVDLGIEPLIWSKNGLQTSALARHRHSFYPIGTRELKRANQKQTDAGQKMNRPTVDLGYRADRPVKSQTMPPHDLLSHLEFGGTGLS
jgi:hypothetical protein